MKSGIRLALPTRFVLQFFLLVVAILFSSFGPTILALEPRDYAIEASAEVLSAPFALRLSWRGIDTARNYTIYRRIYGSTDWGAPRATLGWGEVQFTDTQVSEGIPYEYEIQMESTVPAEGGWAKAYGYLLAGGKVSWPEQKGKVVVVVDAISASTLSSEISNFTQNLMGSGWRPIRRDFPHWGQVEDLKNLIRAEYNADPSNVRSVILLGHLPVPYSGNIAPDLHASHKGAWPADVYYADVDGNWTDSVVDIVSGDYRANDNRPGDGKFDQSEIPSGVELELGRIDFADLPTFVGRSAVDMLRTYLQKNHQFRHKIFTANRRGLIRDNFGDLSGDAPAVDAWRHFPQFFGPGDIREVGPGGFFSTLNNESFLWAYGCGGGGLNKADGVGTTSDFATQNPQAVFLILHGSYFGDWNTTDNFLRAGVAGSGYTLASIWSGLPHWYMHPMALGASVGAVTRLTQNNTGQYKSQQNFSAAQVHVSLMGDPTLEMFPVLPPANLSGSASAMVNLTWSPSGNEGIVGYHVYYSNGAEGPYQRLTSSPVTANAYAHSVGAGTHYYMVRAVKLERTGSGTFYNLSQGIFTAVTKSGAEIPVVSIQAEDNSLSESGPNNGTVKISRSFADGTSLIVDLIVGGTATAGTDFKAIGSSIVIPAGENDARISLEPVTDNVIEGAESIAIELRGSDRYSIGSPNTVSLVIEDLNRAPMITLFSDLTIEAGASSAVIPFQVIDAETTAALLQLRSSTSNPEIVPESGIVLNGSGSNWTVRVSTAAGVTGTAMVTLFVSDGVNETASPFKVTVVPANLPPTATPLVLESLEDTPTEITLSGIDPENEDLIFEILTQPTAGMLIGTNRTYIYTPQTNYFGADTFTFRVRDEKFASDPATVNLNIAPKNDPPTIGIVPPQTTHKNSVTPIVLEVADVDRPVSELLLYAQSSNPGLVRTNDITFMTLAGERSMAVRPVSNATGIAFITLAVSDGQLSNVTSFQFTVTNTPPMAQTDTISNYAGRIVIPLAALLGNDSDADGDPLTVTSVAARSALGRELVLTNETVLYQGADSGGEDSFAYTVADTSNGSSATSVRLVLRPHPYIDAVEVAGDEVTLNISGEANRTFTVWTSEDMKSWNEAGSGSTDAGGAAVYKEKIGDDERHRFFKAEFF